MSLRRRHASLTLIWVIGAALLLAQAAGPVSAIAMLRCDATQMGTGAQSLGVVAPVLCKAACTSHDNLLDGGAGFDTPPVAPGHHWPVVTGCGNDLRFVRQYTLLHAHGPPLRVLLCRFLD